MRHVNNGSFYTVLLSSADVSEFARRWPGFGDIRSAWFQYDRDGNLVDISDNSGMDESGVLALSRDAQDWAARQSRAKRAGRKTITVDHYVPRGTRGPMVADFWYRGELVASILPAVRRDIDDRLQLLGATRDVTHWRSKKKPVGRG